MQFFKSFYKVCFFLFVSIFFHIFLFILCCFLSINRLKTLMFVDKSISIQLFDTSRFYTTSCDNGSINMLSVNKNPCDEKRHEIMAKKAIRKSVVHSKKKQLIDNFNNNTQDINMLKNVFDKGQQFDVIFPPKVISRIHPIYPETARLSGIEGQVIVLYDINVKGRVENIRITSSWPSGIFDHVVKCAMHHWVYEPNQPIHDLVLTFNFCLDDTN